MCGHNMFNNMAVTSLFLSLFCLLNFFHGLASQSESPLQNYIVHVKPRDGRALSESEDFDGWYKSFLPQASIAASSDNQPRMLYSYRNVLSGFAARLTRDQVKAMEDKDGFVSARPERVLRKQTTHTPSFLGLHRQAGVWRDSNFGKGVIIGVLDGGIFPSHPSFADTGLPSPPAKWKGRCDLEAPGCNNKLIGARSFDLAAKAAGNGGEAGTPIDEDGHGTHTASTAAGMFVDCADVLGNAEGTAVGMAPHAHLAIYKVCFGDACPESDILAALDTAVEDGVDILSISLGDISTPFFNDSIAIGSFAAIRKGIFVSCSAGNSGPVNATLSNEAPWILTVGASTVDRRIVITAKLGNGEEFEGQSIHREEDFPSPPLPLVYAGKNGNPDSALCGEGSLKDVDVKNKVVVCERGGGIGRIAKGVEVKNSGGAAMILVNQETDDFSTIPDANVLPTSFVSFADGVKIKAYINSSGAPTARLLFKGTVIGDLKSPFVASFSSRGPSLASSGILKPDIIGPGVGILAAWPFPLDNDTTPKSPFNIMSGTSMSCPHLSGIAALLKSAHPYWSPAAIKSAIMTTASTVNLGGKAILDQEFYTADIFATGAGHVNPTRANDPGLIYDLQPEDYIPYLCGLGYKDKEVEIIAHRPVKCSKESSIAEGELNYPSFSVMLGPSQTFARTVTNVGEACSSYTVNVVQPEGVYVSVEPDKIYFSKANEKATYSVTFSRISSSGKATTGTYSQGFLTWVSAEHRVRSPISVKFQ